MSSGEFLFSTDITGGDMMVSLIEEMWLLPETVIKDIALVRTATTLSALVLASFR